MYGSTLHETPGGVVVVTRFRSPNRRQLLRVIWLHRGLRRRCKRELEKLIDVKLCISWRERTILSVSLWSVADGPFAMGEVEAHVRATRMPAQKGMSTSCGMFTYAGEWRHLMFGTPHESKSPLADSIVD